MRRRRILMCICTGFLMFEVFLLVEQQKRIALDTIISGRVVVENKNQLKALPRSKNNTTETVHINESNTTFKLNSVTLSRKIVNVTTQLPHAHSKPFEYFKNVKVMKGVQNDRVLPNISPKQAGIKNNISNEVSKSLLSSKSDLKLISPFADDERTKIRLSGLEKLCKYGVNGHVDRVLVNPSNTMSYCVAHKVASTHWLRVFRYLWNDTSKGHVSSPSEVSKMDAHFAPRNRLKDHSMNTAKDVDLILNTTRFMFTREPFTRLWSVFIDKFILADNYFWSHHGPKIAKLHNMTVYSYLKPCYQFTFRQFINYVIHTSAEVDRMDDHVRPIHRLCNPCIYKPDFIGKVETMKSDKEKVLKVLNVSWGNVSSSHEDRIYDEMKTIIYFNFHIVAEMHLLMKCLNPFSLGIRIIRAFELNGYIPENVAMALRKKLPYTKTGLLDFVWGVYKASNRTHINVKEQRERLKVEAYQTISLYQMHKLQKLYLLDFKLFDYRLDPPALFYNKKQQ